MTKEKKKETMRKTKVSKKKITIGMRSVCPEMHAISLSIIVRNFLHNY
jgi:hypothetical protein